MKNKKSCLVALIFFLVLVAAGAVVLQRVWRSREEKAPVADEAWGKGLVDRAKNLLGADEPTTEAQLAAVAIQPAAPSPTPGPVGIQDMTLRLSHPLMYETLPARGLATRANYLYLAAGDEEQGKAYLYQLDGETLSLVQMRSLADGAYASIGGIHRGTELVWAALATTSTDAGSRIVGLDAVTLEERVAWDVAERIVAVAQRRDGTVYGYCSRTSAMLEWSPQGERQASHAMATGAIYTDMACVGQSLVCAGTLATHQGSSGVIDVIDSQTLTLLKRIPAHGLGPDGAPLTSHGFCLTTSGAMLAEWRNERNQILTYVPGPGVSAQELFVSVAP